MRTSLDVLDPMLDAPVSRRAFLSLFTAATAAACTHVLSAEREPVDPLRFDGKESFARIKHFAYDGSHPLSIEVTTTPDRIDRDQTILGNHHNGGLGFVLEKGRWTFLCHNGEQYVKAVSDEPATAGEEASLMAVCDGHAVRLYVNGVLQEDAPQWKGHHKASDQPLLLGADPDGTGKPQHHFAGTLRDIRISAMTVDALKNWKKLDLARSRPDHLLLLDGHTKGAAIDRSKARLQIELRP